MSAWAPVPPPVIQAAIQLQKHVLQRISFPTTAMAQRSALFVDSLALSTGAGDEL